MALRSKTNNGNLKSIAWIVEVIFRVTTGWIILSNFDKLYTTALALYALATAGVIVGVHFYKAHK
jgi:hypothetical protein